MVKDRYIEEVVSPGDKASKLARKICVDSFLNSAVVEVIQGDRRGEFRGADDFRWRGYILAGMLHGDYAMTVQNDGAGGKTNFTALKGNRTAYKQAGWEIIAMNADDIVRDGGLPVIMTNELNAKRITAKNFHLFVAFMNGYARALRLTRMINFTGETAVMKYSITNPFDVNDSKTIVFTLGGTCIGLTHKGKKINTENVRPGMYIVGLIDPGYRCNGGTKLTEIGLAGSGNNVYEAFLRDLTMPSKCYAPLITRVHGWKRDGRITDPIVKIAGIAHITGGGLWKKLSEILPYDVGARLDNMVAAPAVLLVAEYLSKHNDKVAPIPALDAYSIFHGGCGMMVICETEEDAGKLVNVANRSSYQARIIGRTTRSKRNEILVKCGFMDRNTQMISSLELEM